MSDLEKQTIVIESDLKKELEEFNFKYRRTEYKINISQVCREALRQELEKRKRSLPGLKQRTLSEEIFKNDKKQLDEPVQAIEENLSERVKEPVNTFENICEICNKAYTSKSKKSKYCSNACSQVAVRERKKRE